MTLSSKYFGFLALWLALAAPVARAETSEAEQIQAALESWVVERAPTEKLSLDDPLGKWLPQYPGRRTSASGTRALGVSCR
jgi:hypothetical protein